jgi:alginate O-acetyltransferase complex protein AlgI
VGLAPYLKRRVLSCRFFEVSGPKAAQLTVETALEGYHVLFNSIQFCLFFPIVTALYFALPHRFRWALLLAASCTFYMAFVPVYILILGFTIVVDYFAGILIEDAAGPKRRVLLACSLVANIGVLFVFKYYNFFTANVDALAHALHWNYSLPVLRMVLPIGLSFHTFQAMSYTIEVYRGKQKAERHFGIYSLYVMFYPQLVAGPIERPQNLLEQFHTEYAFDYRRVTDGLRLMAWGMFKKVVIADRLAATVNLVYSEPGKHQGMPLVIAMYFFAIQIYCDFSGYSEIALGSAEVMGFKLMKNFDRPYASQTVAEFWRHWHISLSTWFRDYLYTPLRERAAGSSVDHRSIPMDTLSARLLRYRDLSIVFLVSGLWHGANWTYVIWGALHALYLVGELVTKDARKKLVNVLGLERFPRLLKVWRIFVVFHLVTIAWVFFRAKTVADALHVLLAAGRGLSVRSIFSADLAAKLATGRIALLTSIALIAFLFAVEHVQSKGRLRTWIDGQPTWLRWGLYYGVAAAVLFFGEYKSQEFIYFQF